MSEQEYDLSRLEVENSGSGAPPVLLLHGWGGDYRTLKLIGDSVSRHREVWSMSLPGFGNSPEPTIGWGTWDYVTLIQSWLDSRKIDKVDIIAHSFGGRVSIGLAALHTESVGRLILMASAGLRANRTFGLWVKLEYARILKRLATILPTPLAKLTLAKRGKLGSSDWRSASPVMRGVMAKVLSQDEDLTAKLPDIKADTLLLWGGRDSSTPKYLGEKMHSLIPKSKLVVYPTAGHYLFLDNRGETISEICEHLNIQRAW